MSGSNKKNKEDADYRKILCRCSFCKNLDMDSGAALEIDFRVGMMVYVCRNCNKENRLSLQPANSSFPDIGIGIGKGIK
jgi:hypothetical protein